MLIQEGQTQLPTKQTLKYYPLNLSKNIRMFY